MGYFDDFNIKSIVIQIFNKHFCLSNILGLFFDSKLTKARTQMDRRLADSDRDIQVVKPKFIHRGNQDCSPIPLDANNIKTSDFSTLKARNLTQDRTREARRLIKGEWVSVTFTHISIPFPSPSSMKGAYICLYENYTPSHLIFALTSSKGEKTSKKYEFPEFKGGHWYFLPVDLPDVLLCEITGGRKKKFFINSLVFIKEENPEEIKSREAREKLWSEAPVLKPEFVTEGGIDSIPIPRDDPHLVDPSFSMVKGKNDRFSKESRYYDRSSEAQRMLKGEDDVCLSHLSIPFPSPCPMKGAYICVHQCRCSPSLLFTFTDCDGKKTSKKYEFTELKHPFEWHFLPIDLDNVVLCEIEGKGRWNEKTGKKLRNTRRFQICGLVFSRVDKSSSALYQHKDLSTPCTVQSSIPSSCIPSKPHKCPNRVLSPILLHKGDTSCIPISGDDPCIRSQMSPIISKRKERKPILFSPGPIKGAYICLRHKKGNSFSFNFSWKGKTLTSIRYKFSKKMTGLNWYLLPIDLSDVYKCDITGGDGITIHSLAFFREETPKEAMDREFREKIWSEAPVIKPKYISGGEMSHETLPFSLKDKRIIHPSFSRVNGKRHSVSKESEMYNQSSQAQRMLKGEGEVRLSHLSIPFPSPCPMKGAYICVHRNSSSPSLLFIFTDCYGRKTSKKYKFTKPKHEYEWHFLPIDLNNVVSCEIKGTGTWRYKKSQEFKINSLFFFMPDIPSIPSYFFKESTLPKKEISTSPPSPDKEEKKKKKEIPSKQDPNDKVSAIPQPKTKFKSLTLTSSAGITPQCIIGNGAFGEVLLIKVDDIPFPCVLKKMLKVGDSQVVKTCRKEFKIQRKLFNNPKCFNRIPRPLYILDLLDAEMKGIYGFIMEFCAGGSVSAFAMSWCVDGKYAKDDEDSDSDSAGGSVSAFAMSWCVDGKYAKDDEDSDSDSFSEDKDYESIDPMTLNPVKVCSLCVGMIECLDDVLCAKKGLVHRDIKPDNFLVRFDPKDGECIVVLGDLGIAHINNSVSTSISSKSFCSVSSAPETKTKRKVCGTLGYMSIEALQGTCIQESDGYSLGMSILALFLCCDPMSQNPLLKQIEDPTDYVAELKRILSKNVGPKLSHSPLFRSLKTIEGGKFRPIYSCLNDIFEGLTMYDIDKRMSVHDAREKVKIIKCFLPKIGEGWKCPSIDDIVGSHRKIHGDVFNIDESCDIHSEVLVPKPVDFDSRLVDCEKDATDGKFENENEGKKVDGGKDVEEEEEEKRDGKEENEKEDDSEEEVKIRPIDEKSQKDTKLKKIEEKPVERKSSVFEICSKSKWKKIVKIIQSAMKRFERSSENMIPFIVSLYKEIKLKTESPEELADLEARAMNFQTILSAIQSRMWPFHEDIIPDRFLRLSLFCALKAILCLNGMDISEGNLFCLSPKHPVFILSRTACVGLNACAFLGMFENENEGKKVDGGKDVEEEEEEKRDGKEENEKEDDSEEEVKIRPIDEKSQKDTKLKKIEEKPVERKSSVFEICSKSKWKKIVKIIQSAMKRFERSSENMIPFIVSLYKEIKLKTESPEELADLEARAMNFQTILSAIQSRIWPFHEDIIPDRFLRLSLFCALKAILCLYGMDISEGNLFCLSPKHPVFILSRTACVGLNACAFLGMFDNENII
ncbi:hypothetical protein ADUPG1_013507 [Aduncisulcus paluster]|uniref:Protein kinase domain-containing protein n=1 Tax=Aduncisulcus paluster TaxID=2918883 RepID=A0ABQ5K385_9EUKA|nr:hypothetical protein ADUPG1_013507 [Aduncisulcus paluster]